MSKRVLILDDDAAFNKLLTNIFSKAKANYDITSAQDPMEALKLVESQCFDLIVTDHRMPNMSGFEFTKLIKTKKPGMPIIMVSAFLDSETIRQLINVGVGGIFLKPLNVFSLLERTAQLLALDSSKQTNKPDRALTNMPFSEHSAQTFEFKTFPCKDPNTARFATNLERKQNFASSLMLIGPKGSPFNRIIDDLSTFPGSKDSTFIRLYPEDINKETVQEKLEAALTESNQSVTFSIPQIDELAQDARDTLSNLVCHKNSWIPENAKVRFILSLNKSPDILLSQNIISDELYLMLGNSEVHIPPLSDCAHDIPTLANQILKKIAKEKNLPKPYSLQDSAINLLQQHSWPNNYHELEALLEKASTSASTSSLSDQDLLVHMEDSPEDSLEERLVRARNDYTRAIHTLNYHDTPQTAKLIDAPDSFVESVVNM